MYATTLIFLRTKAEDTLQQVFKLERTPLFTSKTTRSAFNSKDDA